jgi:hypothetical protein
LAASFHDHPRVPGGTPLVVMAVVVAYVATEALTAYVDSRVAP